MTAEEIKAELEAAKAELNAEREARANAEKRAEELSAKIQDGTTSTEIKGSYKGYKFADGHKRVRNSKGELCDTTKLLAAAADKKSEGHADAVAVLDWLIEINYGYFVKK